MGNMMRAKPTLTSSSVGESVLIVAIDLIPDGCVERSECECLDIFKYVQAKIHGHKHVPMYGRKEGKFVQQEWSFGGTELVDS
jgi:hypothetical protein